MICPNCNNNISDGAKFCPVCGKPTEIVQNVENFYAPQTPPQYRPPQYSQMPPKKSKTGLIVGISIGAVLLIGLLAFVFWPKQTPSANNNGQTQEVTEKPADTAEPEIIPTEEPSEAPVLGLQESYNTYVSEEEIESNRIYFIDAVTSSNFEGLSGVRHANYAIDDTVATSWQEGVEGSGVGSYIELYFDDNYPIHYLEFCIGNNLYGGAEYEKYSRPAEATLLFGDGSSTKVYFEDTVEPQTICIEGGIKTFAVTVTIDKVYEGTEHDRCCLAEVRAYSNTKTGPEEPDFLGVKRENYVANEFGANKFVGKYVEYLSYEKHKAGELNENCKYYILRDEITKIILYNQRSEMLDCDCTITAFFYNGQIHYMYDNNKENGQIVFYYFENGAMRRYYLNEDYTPHVQGDLPNDYSLIEMHNYMMELYEEIKEIEG